MQASLLALEIIKHLPEKGSDMSLEQAAYWREVTFTMSDEQLSTFIRTVSTFNHPLLQMVREVYFSMERANAQ